MKYFIVLLAVIPLLANADIYSWVDENGVRHYSDSKPINKVPFETLGAIEDEASNAKVPVDAREFSSPAQVQDAIVDASKDLVSIQAIRTRNTTIVIEGTHENDSQLIDFIENMKIDGVGQTSIVSNENGRFSLEVLNEKLNLNLTQNK